MKIIAMIPARLGSKRIPKKNLRYLDGKPLIQHVVDLAKESGVFDEIWVNSESKELGQLAKKLEVNFHERPANLANDTATNQQFTEEFLKNHDCDYVIMVNTTSPLLKKETICEFVSFLKANSYDTIFSVVEEKAETFYQDKPLNFSLQEKVNSQLLEPTSKIVWALTAWKKDVFLEACAQKKCGVFYGNYGLFSIPKDECIDLDTEEDWNIAEGMLMSRKIKGDIKYWSGIIEND